MTCNNNLCIYEEDSACSLDEISINELGSCEDCTFIHPSKEAMGSPHVGVATQGRINRDGISVCMLAPARIIM